MTVTLPYPPSANRLWRMWRGRMVLSAEGREYKRTAGLVALAAGMRPLDGNVSVSIHIFRPRRRGDTDNRIKIVNDAMIGVAFGDDDQVTALHVYRHDDKARPRIEFTVEVA